MESKMTKFNRYSGDANIKILKSGKVRITTVVEYPSIEAAGVSITNPEVFSAMNKPVPLNFMEAKRRLA
jgi:hypothetical protein